MDEYEGGKVIKIKNKNRVVGGRVANIERYVELQNIDIKEIPDYVILESAKITKPIDYIVKQTYDDIYANLETTNELNIKLPTPDLKKIKGSAKEQEQQINNLIETYFNNT